MRNAANDWMVLSGRDGSRQLIFETFWDPRKIEVCDLPVGHERLLQVAIQGGLRGPELYYDWFMIQGMWFTLGCEHWSLSEAPLISLRGPERTRLGTCSQAGSCGLPKCLLLELSSVLSPTFWTMLNATK